MRVDALSEALDVMEDAYPDLFARGTFYIDAIENTMPAHTVMPPTMTSASQR